MWDEALRDRLHIGLHLVNQSCFLCGKNRDDLSTDHPQKKLFFPLIHILETLQKAAHIWGVNFAGKAVHSGLLHSECHLSTDKRKLSTNFVSQNGKMGDSPSPIYRTGFIQKKRIYATSIYLIHKQWFRLAKYRGGTTYIKVQKRGDRGKLFPKIPYQGGTIPIAVAGLHTLCIQAQHVAQE